MGGLAVARVVGANPGPAAHVALLGILVAIPLVIVAITRRRRRRDAAEAALRAQHEDELRPASTAEKADDARSTPGA